MDPFKVGAQLCPQSMEPWSYILQNVIANVQHLSVTLKGQTSIDFYVGKEGGGESS